MRPVLPARMLNVAFILIAPMTLVAQDSLNMHSVHQWTDTTLPPSFAYGNTYNEVWGHSQGGREYAIIGSTMGTHIFDITEVLNGVVDTVAFIPGAYQGLGVVHRDMKTYGHYLYIVCDEGQSTLQIVDLLGLPSQTEVVYDSNALFARAHNIFIDTLNARLYTCGGSSSFSVYSLTDPENPMLLLNAEIQLPWWGQQIGAVHDAYVRDNIAYLHDADAFHVVDFTVATSPVIVGSLTSYPGQGYNHSGWLHDDGIHYVMCDETPGKLVKLLDVSDLSDIQVTAQYGSGIDSLSMVHNAFWHGDDLHTSYYHDGYRKWHLEQNGLLVPTGYYDTSTRPHTVLYQGAWGVYPYLPSGLVLVSDMQTGLWVLQSDGTTAVSGPVSGSHRLEVYPVPAVNTIQLRVPSTWTERIHVSACDATGKMLLDRILGPGETSVSIAELPVGCFSIVVRHGNEVRSAHGIKVLGE